MFMQNMNNIIPNPEASRAPRPYLDHHKQEINYQEQHFDYDFDPEDRPCVYPEHSYAKYIYPNNKSFVNLYGSESNAGG